MKTSNIHSFAVYGLFGTTDVFIPFNEDVKILIGENGIGKTQVLNLFYYTLTQNFFRLSEFHFHKLVLTFCNEEKVEITKREVVELVKQTYSHPAVEDLLEEIGFSQLEMLRNKYAHYLKENYARIDNQPIILKGGKKIPFYRLMRVLEQMNEMLEKNKRSSFFEQCQKQIATELGGMDIIYFPTFRRVETDLHNLGYNEEELNLNQENNLIQFGMDDVKNRFNNTETKIDKLLKEGLAQFTKNVLEIVLDDFQPQNNVFDRINGEDIDIIFSRVGPLLPHTQKEAIKNIVAQKQFKNPVSAYLLQKLIDSYEKQKELDNSVKLFRDVCNKYLLNKKVFYDESAIKIFVKSEESDAEIALSQLSSGEKQIISIFSKIYLSDLNSRFIVLFDEPELSLSMLWQKNLLPDIINSKKCKFLLAVTHSPFIFDNELDQYAVGLSEYIQKTTSRVV